MQAVRITPASATPSPREHLRDFADMAGIEFLLIDENTKVDEFNDKLRWNDLYYHLSKSL
jgi:L-arabinose isomerase